MALRSRNRLAATAFAALAAMAPAAFGQKPPSAGQSVVSAKIDARVTERARTESVIPVLVVLKNQPQIAIAGQVEAANALAQRIADSDYERVAERPFASLAELSQAAAAAEAVTLETRRQAFQAIDQAIRPEQDALESRLAGLGAARISRYRGVNMLAARIPATALAALEADASIARVFADEVRYADLANSVPALGAPAFWSAGHSGEGQSVGVMDTGARTDHPAFAGKTMVGQVFLSTASTDPCFGDDATSYQDQNGHGTHVTGIVMSQGSSGWAAYQGVAKGVGTLYVLKVGFNLLSTGSCHGGGESYDSDTLAAIDWAVANTPLTVLNYSFGGAASGDDDDFAQSIDQYADTYGLTIAIAAGNAGPGAGTVESPGLAYNSITAANWSSRGSINSSSSRGPTSGGRYKPDLAAPGTSIFSTAYNWDNSTSTIDDFIAMTGTSMASPHLAGSAAVLRSAGVADALALKAVLVNTTDNTGWAADRGWGFTNLTTAQQEPNYATGSLAAGAFQLYKVTPAGPFQSSVAWNRHISGGTSYFNNIDLYLFRADTGAQLSSSTATIQNVEQVSATYSGDAVVAVDMVSSPLAGVSSEPYGAAFTVPATVASGPSLSPSCTLPASISSGTQFTLSCAAINGGDLTAFAVTAQAALPSGFSGTAQASLGNVAAGQTSAAGGMTLTASSTAGTYSIPVTVTSNSYGETFSGTASYTANVTSSLPAPALISPANGATGVSLTPSLGWNASSGAASYDVYLATTSPPVKVANTTATSYSPAALNAGTVYYWQVVARSGSVSSGSATWSFTTALAAVTLVSPANAATGVSLTSSLIWNASSGAASYDVYFGTASTPPLLTNTTATSYPPGTLAAGTTYYWSVVAKAGSVSASSPTWSFTTLVAGPAAPLLVSPSNGATGVSASSVLSWSAASGATSYDVYFGTASTPPLLTNTTATSYSPGALSAGTLYYWRVVAKNSGGSNGSATWSFTTQVAGPAAPLLVSPANGAAGVSLAPSLSWNAASGATSYDVFFGTASAPSLVANVTATTYSPGTLSAGTLYYWRVVANNAGGSNSSATWSFTTLLAGPALVSPAQNAVGVGVTPTLSWTASPGAASYDVSFGTVNPPPRVANTTAATYSPGTLSPGVTYYWFVVAKSGGAAGSSPVWWFTTQLAPPVLSSPANGAAGVSLTPALNWSATVGAESYDVHLGTSSSPPLAATTSATGYTPPALAPNTVYYWQVVANGSGSSASATWSFTTQAAAPPLVTPANGATGVSVAPVLIWSASPGATSYDVYFGTQPSPPLVSNTTGTSYSSGTLAAGGQYYWQVVAKGAGAASPSAIWTFTVMAQPPAPLAFIPVAPCRVADTRNPQGAFGGPSMAAQESRSFTIPQSACGIPSTAQAYSLNVTVVPHGSLSFLTLWPAGQPLPLASTLNSGAGLVVANAAIVPAGADGAVSVYVTDPADVILDIDGYFDSAGAVGAFSFYPATPCRIADTRNAAGAFGGPSFVANESRDFAIPSSACALPASATAYSLNVTVVPPGPLFYLTTWPSGQPQPGVSTLNSWTGRIVANAALVPAGAGGAISVFVTNPTDVVLDTNGYFAPPGAGGLSFYAVTPCRVVDTRDADGPFGGPIIDGGTVRSFAVPVSACNIPATAAAYSLNVTVVPETVLRYLTVWPAGQEQPYVSTLNSFDGSIVANAAIVPAGANGAISVYVTEATHVILDINGYFAP